MTCQVIVLAAGNGRRMQSSLPKVMHEVGGKPMLDWVMTNAKNVTDDVILVHSLQLEPYIACYQKICKFVLQEKAFGTAHAVYAALPLVDDSKIVAVLYGDNPFITANIIKDLLNHLVLTNSAMATLCFRRDNPGQYGRIITDSSGEFLRIVEFKEANNEELAINICNSGIMVFAPSILRKYLTTIILYFFHNSTSVGNLHVDPVLESSRTSQYAAVLRSVSPTNSRAEASYERSLLGKISISKEIYLTALVKIAKDNGEKVSYLLYPDDRAVTGVNTVQELEEANRLLS